MRQIEGFEEPVPEWITGLAHDYLQFGAQLCTRDGRKIGNAVVLSIFNIEGELVAEIRTDRGTILKLTRGELEEYFYQPKWTIEID